MWLHRKKTKGPSEQQDRRAHLIAGAIIQKQLQLSKMISEKLEEVPVKRLKLLLLTFCILGSGMSIYLFTGAGNSRSRKNNTISIDQVQRTTYPQSSKDGLLQQAAVRKSSLNHILNTKRYLDSLRRDINGKKLYDSLLLARPFLMDSMGQLETIYSPQHKK